MEHIAGCSHNKFLGVDTLIASQAAILRINSGKKETKKREHETLFENETKQTAMPLQTSKRREQNR